VNKIRQFFKVVLIVYRHGIDVIFRDPLTNLYNRRFLEEIGPKEIERARAQRYGRPLSLVLFDLDGFKEINDYYGHQYGDTVLERVARVLKDHCRKADILVRWGGDEFLLLLPETTGVGAEQFIRRIIRELRAEDIHLSYGVVPWQDEKYSSLEEFIKEGDRRLYKHKQLKKEGKSRG